MLSYQGYTHGILEGHHLAEPDLVTLAQNKEMRRYTPGPRYDSRPRGEAGITAQYLEAMDDDELGGDSDDADGLTATERARNALRRNINVRWPALLEPCPANHRSRRSLSDTFQQQAPHCLLVWAM